MVVEQIAKAELIQQKKEFSLQLDCNKKVLIHDITNNCIRYTTHNLE